MRSSTALTINGSATVASSKTSANFPPSFRRQHGIGEFLEIFERIEAQQRAFIPQPRDLVQRKINAQLRIAERRNKNRDIVFVRGFQNSPPRSIVVQVFADAAVNFPA